MLKLLKASFCATALKVKGRVSCKPECNYGPKGNTGNSAAA